MTFPFEILVGWRRLAVQQRRLGAEAQARTLEWCAEELEEALEGWQGDSFNLQEAAEWSGYSADHLGRLVREGKLENAGRPGAPRIRRADLPRKTLREGTTLVEFPPSRKEQVVRSIVADEGG